MKFEIRMASDWDYKETVEITGVDGFKELQRISGNCKLILDFNNYNGIPTIMIYDDYIE